MEVAVIVTWPPTGIAGGAVNTAVPPLDVDAGANENSPQATAGVQDQVTPAALGSWTTVAATFPPVLTAKVVGAVVKVTARCPLLPQPATPKAHTESRTIQRVPRFIAALLPLRTSRRRYAQRERQQNHARCELRIGDHSLAPGE